MQPSSPPLLPSRHLQYSTPAPFPATCARRLPTARACELLYHAEHPCWPWRRPGRSSSAPPPLLPCRHGGDLHLPRRAPVKLLHWPGLLQLSAAHSAMTSYMLLSSSTATFVSRWTPPGDRAGKDVVQQEAKRRFLASSPANRSSHQVFRLLLHRSRFGAVFGTTSTQTKDANGYPMGQSLTNPLYPLIFFWFLGYTDPKRCLFVSGTTIGVP